MARIVTVTSPTSRTDMLLQEASAIDGLISTELYRGASINPPGDVIKWVLPNGRLNRLMRVLDRYQLGQPGGVSVSTSEPGGVVSTGSSKLICRDNNEATWEEMELTVSDDSNTTPSTLCIMFISGSLAAAGIATNALHVVIGGMLIAPGFMPITRVALGVVARQVVWRYGLIDLVRGYGALMVGAFATTWLLTALNYDPLPGAASYYAPAQKLVDYWTTITAPGVITSLVSGVAGGLLVASRRSVLASGVMVGLALVPAAALVAMGLAQADVGLAMRALQRFAIEIGLVFTTSVAVFGCVRRFLHKRDMRL